MIDDKDRGTPAAVAEAVARADGYRERMRALRGESHSAELAEAFRTRAHGAMRRDPAEAGQLARLGLVVARKIRDRDLIVACLRSFAQARLIAGEFTGALAALDQARDLAQDGAGRARVDTLRVQALAHLERHDEALDAGDRAIEAFESQDDPMGVVRVHMALADLAFRLDRPRDALSHYRVVDGLLPANASPGIRGALAANRANALEACNRFRASVRQFDIARTVFSAAGAEHTVAQVDANAAYAEMLRGRFEDSLRLYAKSESVFHRLEDDRHLAQIDLERAEIHLHLNLPEDVVSFARSAETRFADLGLEKECAQAALLIGRAEELLDRPEQAEEWYGRAEKGFEKIGLAERRVACVIQRAESLRKSSDLGSARRMIEGAGALLTPEMNPLTAAAVGLVLARVDLDENNPASALVVANRVLDDCRRIHAPWVKIEAHRLIGRAHVLKGSLHLALASYRRAIDHIEQYRGGVPPDEYMAAFLAGRAEIYEETVEVLVRLGDAKQAFEFAERAKSRALVDLLAGRTAGTGPAEPNRRTSGRLSHLREKLAAVYRRLFKKGGEPDARSLRAAQEARRTASELETEIGKLLREARLTDPESTSLQTVESPDLAQVQKNLDEDTALVEYYLTDEAVYTFVVTENEVFVVRKDTGRAEIRQLLHRFHFHLAKFQRFPTPDENAVLGATRANLEKLSEILLAPIAEHLTVRRLVVVPHGVMHHLPFHALPLGEGWVTDAFEVVYAPSAAVYGYCADRGPRASGRPAIFGVPDEFAPQIADETRRLADVLHSDRVFLSEEATISRLEEEAASARILHIATHGMFRHQQPMLSAIRLADGWVNLYDLYRLRVKGELVVLSSCESGTADVTDGDEILGLTRGFLYAGAPALLTSQWRVNDAVTTEFMDRFYQGLDSLEDAAAAHRFAMAEIRKLHPHPYYWAPFFLTGRPVPRPSAAKEAQKDHDLTRPSRADRQAVLVKGGL